MTSQTVDLASILKGSSDHLLISTEGEDKAGKTTFELSAPGPLGIQDFDFGIARAISGRPDLKAKLEMPGTEYHSYSFKIPARLNRKNDAEVLKQFEPVLDRFLDDFYKMVDNPAIRTIIWDTATEIWKIIQYVGSGRMEKIPWNLRPEMNARYRGLLDAAGEAGKHMVLTHKVKNEWAEVVGMDGKKSTSKTGNLVRDGFDELHYAVDTYLRCRGDIVEPTPEKPDRVKFSVEFIKTGFNAKLLTGSVWDNADWSLITGLMLG